MDLEGSTQNVFLYSYPLGAALALIGIEGMDVEEIGRRAMKIASDKCIYTNSNYQTILIDENGKIIKNSEI